MTRLTGKRQPHIGDQTVRIIFYRALGPCFCNVALILCEYGIGLANRVRHYCGWCVFQHRSNHEISLPPACPKKPLTTLAANPYAIWRFFLSLV
jgi:hypothetical protein